MTFVDSDIGRCFRPRTYLHRTIRPMPCFLQVAGQDALVAPDHSVPGVRRRNSS